MTTITTVGYGDITASNTFERFICVLLHIIGVLSYSLAAGSLTSILVNHDDSVGKSLHRKMILDRIHREH